MAQTIVPDNNRILTWDSDFFTEYQRKNQFSRYMKSSSNAVIHVDERLGSQSGESIGFTLINALKNAPITGSNTLEGNEESMVQRTFRVYIDQIRNGVVYPMLQQKWTSLSLRDAAKEELKTWIMNLTRDDIIAALHSKNGVAYGTATEAEKDAWLVDNADRVLFGASKSNNSGNDHSASLANIDSTNDKLTTGALSLMKRMALTATPKINPVREDGTNGRHYYVAFVHPLVMRDLKADTTLTQAQREVSIRNQNNKLFEGGDVEWDGVIVHETDEMPVISGVGASGIDVSPVFFCGAQAVAMAYGQRTKSVERDFDYGELKGLAIGEIRGIKKMLFGSGVTDRADLKDHGVLTGYFAAVSDS
jgi:N4-gp56 family major capsid protein